MTFPFDPKGDLVLVSAEVFGPTGSVVVDLALDTGATNTALNSGVLVAIGFDPATEKQQVKITTGSGIVYAPVVTLKKLVALGKEKRKFRVLCHTLPPSAMVDGLLGLDFLRKCRLALDFRKGIAEIG